MIMKKTYITPFVECIEVDLMGIIALSTQSATINTDNQADFEMLSREMNRSIEMLNQVWQ